MTFCAEKLEWSAYRTDSEKFEDILFVWTEFTNKRTDTQTPHDGIYRACIASRGKTCATAGFITRSHIFTINPPPKGHI